MSWEYNDGGRGAAGYKGETRDCAARAIAIAFGCDYREARKVVAAEQRKRKRKGGKRESPDRGVMVADMRRIMAAHGWRWVPTMEIGSGCRVHPVKAELPKGMLILRLARHFAAFADGVVFDTWDSSKEGTACVYGYWQKEGGAR